MGRVEVMVWAPRLSLVIVLLNTPAWAASEPDVSAERNAAGAWALLQRGIELFSDGAFTRSQEVLREAAEKTDDPRLLAQIRLHIGLNHAADNRFDHAKQAFRRALSHDPHLEIDPERHKPAFVRLFGSVRDSMVGRLAITVDRPDVSLWIDGNAVGEPPHEAWLMAGTHRILVRLQDGTPAYQKSVVIVAGQVTRLFVALGSRLRESTSQPAASQADQRMTSRHSLTPVRRRRIWTWVAGGGALAAAAVAITMGFVARAKRDEACSLLADPSVPCEERSRLGNDADLERYGELYDSVGAATLTANIAWGVTGALAATAAVLFWLEGRPYGQREAAVKLLYGRSGLGLAVRY